MLSSEQILEKAASDGSIDVAEWPRVLETLLQRLHDIVYNDFPIPTLPPPPPQPTFIDPEVVASTPPRTLTSDNTDPAEHDLPDADADPETLPNSQSSSKENDAPRELAAGRPPSLPPPHPGYPVFEMSESQQTEAITPGQMAGLVAQHGALPPELLSLYQSSRRVLEYDFAEAPPYTIQRLAEMILHPTKHYRFLPAYLRALDRIVSVSSPVSDFPLPTLHTPLNGGFLTNGDAQVNGISEREGLGSDESLGGALLTPIPWLRNQTMLTSNAPSSDGELHSESTETIEGPHGAGSIETVSVTVNGISSASHSVAPPSSSPIASPTLSEQSDASTSSASSTEVQLREQGGVTQGELLRQEQEAGVVPVTPSGHPMTPRRSLISSGAAAVGRDPAPLVDDEQPHARGPEAMTLEDMGPQPHSSGAGGLDMEAAVGRGRSKSPQPPMKTEEGDEMEVEKAGLEVKTEGEDDGAEVKEEGEQDAKAEPVDTDGDVMVTDADGEPADAEIKEEEKSDDEKKPEVVDSQAL